MSEKTERVLLFWSKRSEQLIDQKIWDSADRVVEIPDDISATLADEVARKLTTLMHEELSRSKAEKHELRVVPLGPPAFQDILEHVINTQLSPFGGGWVILRSRPTSEDAPRVIIDQDTASKACSRYKDPDFKKPADQDKRLFNDDLPPTLEPPVGWKKGEAQ
jgi:hypothetical protein